MEINRLKLVFEADGAEVTARSAEKVAVATDRVEKGYRAVQAAQRQAMMAGRAHAQALEMERAQTLAAAEALGGAHVAALHRDRNMLLAHGEALAINTRLELQNAAAVRTMALAQAEAIKMDQARSVSSKLMNLGGGLLPQIAGFAALGVGVGFFRKLASETIEAQNAMAQLEAAVASTGGAAGYSAEQLADMANEMQRLTTFSDETVMSAQAVLLTFDKIRGETFPRAMQAAANLATRMGGDLSGAALVLGKALQDPEAGLTALSRRGITFTESQKDVIRALFNTGHEAQAQAIMLKELEQRMGGAAAAARNTLGGALAHLSNQFGELFEASSKSTDALVKGLNNIAAVLPTVNRWLGETLELWMKVGAVVLKPFGYTPPAAVDPLRSDPALNKKIWEQEAKIAGDQAKMKDDAKAVTAALADELAKQQALNAALGETAFAIQRVSIAYDAAAKRREFAVDHTPKEIAAYNAVSRALEAAALHAVDWNEAIAGADKVARMERYTKAVNDATAALAKMQPQLTGVGIVGPNVAKLPSDDPKYAAIEARAAAQAFSDDMRRIAADGIGKIVTDGFKSYHDFFEDVLRLFSKLMDRMEEEATRLRKEVGGALYRAMKLGSAGIAGGLAGYGIGSQIGTAAGGVGAGSILGAGQAGAIAGGLVGTTILPGWGSLVGGIAGALAGMTGALISGTKAARERKEAEEALRITLASSINAMRVLVGEATPLSQALIENAGAFKAMRAGIEAAYAGRKNEAERELMLAESYALEAKRILQLQEENKQIAHAFAQSLQERQLRALGRTEQADALRQQIENERELAEARKAGLDVVALAFTQMMEAAKRAADETRRVRDSLKAYSNSLSSGPLSTLTPVQKYNEAKAQYEVMARLAAGGDKSALASLPETANAFLEASRRMYGSTERYVNDFNQVKGFIDEMTRKYDAQLSLEEQTLRELQKQTAIMQGQVPGTPSSPYSTTPYPPSNSSWPVGGSSSSSSSTGGSGAVVAAVDRQTTRIDRLITATEAQTAQIRLTGTKA